MKGAGHKGIWKIPDVIYCHKPILSVRYVGRIPAKVAGLYAAGAVI